MTDEMTRDEFWTLVESVGWGNVDCDYERGKAILMAALPTYAHVKVYERHYRAVRNALVEAIEAWEQAEEKQLPVSDDGYSDLLAHLIGLGRDEVDRVVADPEKAYNRAMSGAYVESFGYCTPYETDYDPTEVKLARAEDGLRYWQEQADDRPDYEVARSEVTRRAREVTDLRAQLAAEGGVALSVADYEARLAAQEAREDEKWDKLADLKRARETAREALLEAFEAEWEAKRQAILAEYA